MTFKYRFASRAALRALIGIGLFCGSHFAVAGDAIGLRGQLSALREVTMRVVSERQSTSLLSDMASMEALGKTIAQSLSVVAALPNGAARSVEFARLWSDYLGTQQGAFAAALRASRFDQAASIYATTQRRRMQRMHQLLADTGN